MHFSPDEANTRWEIDLLLKIGGGQIESGRAQGIHWHTDSDHVVEYIAADPERQQIPWVRMTDKKTGAATEYVSTENPISEDAVRSASIRRMDCMDCHNRPTHILRSPSAAMNQALAAGSVDPALPQIKSKGVEVLAAQYTSTEEALAAINKEIRQFYHQQYPELEKHQGSGNFICGGRHFGDLSDQFFPGNEGALECIPRQCGPPDLSRLLSLSRWPAPKPRRQDHLQ